MWSPSRNKYIKQLETLPGVHPYAKAEILFVYGSLKPSTMNYFEGESFYKGESPKHVDEKFIKQLEKIVKGLGLKFIRGTKIVDDTGKDGKPTQFELLYIFISQQLDVAKKLKQFIIDDWEDQTLEIGMLLGYPKTAVKAFAQETVDTLVDIKLLRTLRSQDVSDKNMRLLSFRVSKKYWQEEAKILEEYGNYLAQVSPEIYSEITS